MKRIASIVIFLCVLGSLLVTQSCKKEVINLTPTVTLKADAGPDQTAALFSTVTLDGSASTGDPNLDYTWVYNGPYVADENAINFQNKNSVKATFVPPVNGVYTFTLEVRKTPGSNQFESTDQISVTVSGFISIGGTLTANLNLLDVEVGAGPDYKITSDLIVPAGISISGPAGIIIEVGDNVAVRIQGGSIILANLTKFTSAAGWKGILLESGTLDINGELQNAGKSTIANQTEAAAVTTIAGTVNLVLGFTNTTSTSYEVLVTSPLTNIAITGCRFGTSKPVKIPIGNLTSLSSNSYSTYDYITLSTPGAGTTVAAGTSSGFVFQQGSSYYIDGDFTAGSQISVPGSTTILMKAGAGILASAGINTSGGDIFDGLNSAPWKGIAVGGGSGSTINGTTIKNAGSAVFNTGSFTSDVKAGVYFFANGNGSMSNSEIKDSQGYGYYNASGTSYLDATAGNTFTNSALPGISTNLDLVPNVLGFGTTITFTMPANVAAMEVRVPSSTVSPIGTWPALGASNFYLLTNNVFQSGGSWTLNPGVNLKIKTGKSIDIEQGLLNAIGTALNPITFDSESGAAGSWAGMILESSYHVEFCTIANGGSTSLFKGGVTPATELATIVFNYGGGLLTNTFKNNTIKGGAGYGILVESGKQNPDAANVNNANTFSNNSLGNIIVK